MNENHALSAPAVPDSRLLLLECKQRLVVGKRGHDEKGMAYFEGARVDLYGVDFYMRKYLLDKQDGKTETRISRLLLERQPLDCVAKVYGISMRAKGHTAEYIDSQMLFCTYYDPAHLHLPLEKKPMPNLWDPVLRADIRRGIESLHSIGVVFLDMHQGNVGYDYDRRQWCLFDFGMCGMFDVQHDTSFTVPPFAGGWIEMMKESVHTERDHVKELVEEFLDCYGFSLQPDFCVKRYLDHLYLYTDGGTVRALDWALYEVLVGPWPVATR